MHAQLQVILDQFHAASGRVDRIVAGLPDNGWTRKPASGGWSVAECVAHLNLTAAAYRPIVTDALERARELGGPAPGRYRRDLIGFMICYAAGPLPKVAGRRIGRAPTAPAFVPSGLLDRETVLAEFAAVQEEQTGWVHASDGLPIDRVKISSPFAPRLFYNLYSTLIVLARHEHRHINQAEDVLSSF